MASGYYGTWYTAHPRKTLVGGKYKEVININVNLCLFTSLKSVNKLCNVVTLTEYNMWAEKKVP